MEGIERDREIVRGMKKFDRDSMDAAYLESLKEKKITYIPNLLAASKSTSLRNVSRTMSLKIKGMSTRNILFAVSESFRNINKKTIKRLERIKEELSGREDLFDSILDHMETIDLLEDDFFSWYPGLKTCDIFSFFLELIPDLLCVYKKYFVECLVLHKSPRRKILNVFRDRMSKNLQCFDVIERDLTLFEEISREKLGGGRVITSSYWTDNTEKCEEALRFFPQIDGNVKLNSNICVELFHPLSYAEISVNNKDLVVSFVQLNDLLTRNDRSLEFWMQAGIVDEDWEYM